MREPPVFCVVFCVVFCALFCVVFCVVFCIVFWVVFCVVFRRQEVLVLYVLILLLPPAGVSSMTLRSILHSISEARGASFVCFNTSAVSSWGQHNDSA